MKKVFKHYLDIPSRGKSDKDVVASCSIFDKYIFSKNTFQCFVIKISKLYNLSFTSLKQVKSVRFL